MPKRKPATPASTEDLLRDLLIVQLAIAGLPRDAIRGVVRVNNNRVARILKHVNKRKRDV